ncbi:MAG: Rcs stress response system protein RcsF [Colwellia sp.]|nr:Rcs stress response system protein RcsF [Colwellia sp.]MCW9081393.1 Rcs stress response system protein RcsF [Colwellia sp.]
MKFLLLIIFFFLSGCSTATFDSNVGIYAENKIRKSVVERYTNYEVWELGATQVGHVETRYCQQDIQDYKPSKEALISELEVKTQKLGGNALVFDSCLVNRTTGSCHTQIHCNGMAYQITYNK